MMRRRTTHLMPTAIAVLALTLTGCGGEDDADTAADAASPTPTSTSADETLALTADSAAAGKCAVPNAETLATFDTAFAGTVTSLDDGTATLSVDEWYAGGEAATVSVESPSGDLPNLLMAVDFEEGKTYLVSASAERVTLCGFTGEQTPELQALYDEAYQK